MPRQQPSSPKKKRKQLGFEDWYEIAKKYYEEHGDLLVPRIYEDEEGHKLGRWIERLRAFYNGNPKIKVALTQTGITMLEKIGMVWKLENRYPWPEWYLQCRLYCAANGDLLVPKMYKNEQYALGNWIGEQRKKYKKGTLKPEQVEALEKVGMVWELVDRDVWEKRYNDAYAYYECIKAYVEEHHQLPVYKNSFELPDGGQSAQWIANRRTQMHNGMMPEERVKMLADIGIVYGSLADNWRENYNAIKAYLDEHGELPLKEASITLPTGSQSHWWIRNQTLMLHQGRQSEDKVKLLNEIGIV